MVALSSCAQHRYPPFELVWIDAPDIHSKQRSDDGKDDEYNQHRCDCVNHFWVTTVECDCEAGPFFC